MDILGRQECPKNMFKSLWIISSAVVYEKHKSGTVIVKR
jgi:hypothetical protein